MTLFRYLAGVRLNETPLIPDYDYQIRDGKLWIEQEGKIQLRNGDSLLLTSTDDEKWASRRIFIGPGGTSDLYLHPDMFHPPVTTTTRAKVPEAEGPRESQLARRVQEQGATILELSTEVGRLRQQIEVARKALE